MFYTIALQTPEREFGVEDVLLHIQVLGYTVELVTRVRPFSHRPFVLWRRG